jgi:hypothetical protein
MGRKATAGVITMILIGAVVACSDPTSIYSPLDSLPSPDGKASAVTGAEIRGSTGRYAVSLLKNSEESDDTTVFIATVPGKSDFGILRKKPWFA